MKTTSNSTGAVIFKRRLTSFSAEHDGNKNFSLPLMLTRLLAFFKTTILKFDDFWAKTIGLRSNLRTE